MLTVNYDKLGVQPGDRLLDLGCGAGRHAFEALKRGANVVAFDYDKAELSGVTALFAGMAAEGETPDGTSATAANGDACRLPFPDGSFDRVIASEVLEHIPDDSGALSELTRVLRPGGTIAITVPAWFSERICWMLSDEYYAPKAEGGHLRIYKESEMRGKMSDAGLEPLGSHKEHGLHAPYWWLRCAVGVNDDDHPATKAYHRLLVWDIAKAPFITRTADRMLNPLIGKSVVVYGLKPLSAAKDQRTTDATARTSHAAA